jgi:hypothetical protein
MIKILIFLNTMQEISSKNSIRKIIKDILILRDITF